MVLVDIPHLGGHSLGRTFAPLRVQIDYHRVEKKIQADYREVRQQYRLDDEIEVTTENHYRLCQRLKSICRSFNRPIRVLDVGCGTGRYFHCVENTDLLMGLDVSNDMLEAARSPVKANEIVARSIELKQGNAYLIELPENSFDLIYSLGMFGHGCPVTPQVLEKFYRWLSPGGKLLFNTVDFAGLPMCYRVRRRVKAWIYPLLSRTMKRTLDERESKSPFFGMRKAQLKHCLRATEFKRVDVQSHECKSPLWNGRHLECFAERD